MPQYHKAAVIDDITIIKGSIENANIKAEPFWAKSKGKVPPPRYPKTNSVPLPVAIWRAATASAKYENKFVITGTFIRIKAKNSWKKIAESMCL